MLDYNLEFKQPACPTCEPDYYTPTPYRASDHDPVIIGLALLAVARNKDSCKNMGWTNALSRRRFGVQEPGRLRAVREHGQVSVAPEPGARLSTVSAQKF